MNNKFNSKDLKFVPGEQIELYFFDEKVEYRFEISKRSFEEYSGFLIVRLPYSKLNDFYKGEDYMQCRYVHKNVVYEFTGEIIRIIKDSDPCIIIKPSNEFKEFNQRKQTRIAVEIVAEYNIESGIPGLNNGITRGFIVIKDASSDGISFQTTDTIPINAIIGLDLYRDGISMKVQVKKVQIVNEKNFYGGLIIDMDDVNKSKFNKLLEKKLNEDKFHPIY